MLRICNNCWNNGYILAHHLEKSILLKYLCAQLSIFCLLQKVLHPSPFIPKWWTFSACKQYCCTTVSNTLFPSAVGWKKLLGGSFLIVTPYINLALDFVQCHCFASLCYIDKLKAPRTAEKAVMQTKKWHSGTVLYIHYSVLEKRVLNNRYCEDQSIFYIVLWQCPCFKYIFYPVTSKNVHS